MPADELLRQVGAGSSVLTAQRLLDILNAESGNPHLDQVAGLALCKLAEMHNHDEQLIQLLLLVLTDSQNVLDRAWVARALGETRRACVVEPLVKALHSTYPQIRGAAADGLGATLNFQAVEPLSKVLLNPTEDEVVRANSATALAKIGQARSASYTEHNHIVQLLQHAQSDRPSATLRANIVVALEELD